MANMTITSTLPVRSYYAVQNGNKIKKENTQVSTPERKPVLSFGLSMNNGKGMLGPVLGTFLITAAHEIEIRKRELDEVNREIKQCSSEKDRFDKFKQERITKSRYGIDESVRRKKQCMDEIEKEDQKIEDIINENDKNRAETKQKQDYYAQKESLEAEYKSLDSDLRFLIRKEREFNQHNNADEINQSLKERFPDDEIGETRTFITTKKNILNDRADNILIKIDNIDEEIKIVTYLEQEAKENERQELKQRPEYIERITALRKEISEYEAVILKFEENIELAESLVFDDKDEEMQKLHQRQNELSLKIKSLSAQMKAAKQKSTQNENNIIFEAKKSVLQERLTEFVRKETGLRDIEVKIELPGEGRMAVISCVGDIPSNMDRTIQKAIRQWLTQKRINPNELI